jgi:L-asparagine transporter-like permease
VTSATGLVIGSIIGTGVFTMRAVLAGAGVSSLLVLGVIAVGAMILGASAVVYLLVSAAVMGLVPHHALIHTGAPFVNAFGTIFTGGAWAGKLIAAVAVVSGIGALNGWTLVTTEVSRAAAEDGLFPRQFAWTDRKDTAWFGIVMAARSSTGICGRER